MDRIDVRCVGEGPPTRLHYDPEVDASYLRLGESKIIESEEVRPGVVLDYDEHNRVVGLEVHNLRKRFPAPWTSGRSPVRS